MAETTKKLNGPPGGGRRATRYLEGGLTLVIAAAVVAFYIWTVRSNGGDFSFHGKKKDYYNLLADGFLDGHLWMKVKGLPAAGATVSNQLPPGAPFLLDASFYHGNYYLYFGITPAVTVFLPYALLTGQSVPPAYVAVLFAALGFALSLAWLQVIRQEFYPRAATGIWLVLVGALGLCNAAPAALRRPLFYEVAIMSGYAWGSACLLFATLAVLRRERAGRWLVAAGLSAGLAVGSRANLLPGALVTLSLAVAWILWHERQGTPGAPWCRAARLVMAGGLPIACCLVALFWYNQARFGSLFEFGQRYQLGSNPTGFRSSPEFFWHNLKIYYLTPPDAGWYFPFFAPGTEGVPPTGYWGVEQAHGQFFHLPFILALLAAGAARIWRRRTSPAGLGVVVMITTVWFAVNFAIVASFGVRTNRYMLDFHPALLALTGLMILAGAQAAGVWWRWLTRGGAAWLGMICAYNVFISFQVHAFFLENNPSAYAALGRFCDRLVWPLQRASGSIPGPIELEVTFPDGHPGRLQPMVVAGTTGFTDAVLVECTRPGFARLVFDHENYGRTYGGEFALEPGRSRRLSVYLGTLLPPAWHPWWGTLDEVRAQRLRNRVRVALDDRDLLALDAPCFEASPNQVRLGRRERPLPGEDNFSGRVQLAKVLGPDLAWFGQLAGQCGPVRLRVVFPRDRYGVTEPLLVFQHGDELDAFLVAYLDESTIQLSFQHVRGLFVKSKPIRVDYARSHEFEVSLEALRYRSRVSAAPHQTLRVLLDGRTVLFGTVNWHDVAPFQIYTACSPMPISACRRLFGGQVMEVSRRMRVDHGHEVPFKDLPGPLCLQLRLPLRRTGMAEPLVTTGITGRGDGLYVRYISETAVVVGFDHWGIGSVESAPISVDYDAEQTFWVSFGALLPIGHPEAGRARVKLNGTVVLNQPFAFNVTAPGQIVIGENPIGLSTSQATFTGDVFSVEAGVQDGSPR